jgi:site-specific recombinase XerD
MLTTYFKSPCVLQRLRATPTAQYLDGFADSLRIAGYSRAVIPRLLRIAAHLGVWAQASGYGVERLDETIVAAFCTHLPHCRCPQPNGGRAAHARVRARRFLDYLRNIGVVPLAEEPDEPKAPAIATGFLRWMQLHRGVTASTLRIYARVVADLLNTVGEVPERYSTGRLRAFVLKRSASHGRASAKSTVTALRMFLRYLTAEGKCRADLAGAIPTVAQYRLSSLPRYLPAGDVERIIGACDPRTSLGARDRAILLLLARLALRASDIVGLRLSDIEWTKGELRVSGKGRRETRLPLSQEVGDALLGYLDIRPSCPDTDYLFLRACAPIQGPLSSTAISTVVARAIRRAGVSAPSCGAHVLRHSAATEMLRQGVVLEDIAAILRHRSIETTAHYAKVDLALLRQVIQPWPEVSPC